MKKLFFLIFLALSLSACGTPKVNQTYTQPAAQPSDIPPPTDLLTAPIETAPVTE